MRARIVWDVYFTFAGSETAAADSWELLDCSWEEACEVIANTRASVPHEAITARVVPMRVL